MRRAFQRCAAQLGNVSLGALQIAEQSHRANQGAAPTFRLMMHPDGGRLGLDRLEKAIDETFDRTAGLLQQPAAVKALLLGED